jgi:hypothetical protein
MPLPLGQWPWRVVQPSRDGLHLFSVVAGSKSAMIPSNPVWIPSMPPQEPVIPLSFSQAQGLEPLPQPLALYEVSDGFRVDIWNWLYSDIFKTGLRDIVFGEVHTKLRRQPIDSYQVMDSYGLKDPILQSLRYNLLFDLIQFILRLPEIASSPQFSTVKRIFRENMLAYDLLLIAPYGPTIVPTASPEEGEAVQTAFAQLASGPFDGARTHLRHSAEFLNAGNPAKAVGEAVHSIESLVRIISPSKSFGQALAALEVDTKMHPAFKEALNKLYGYTSDEKGIRHPLIESSTSNVGMAEAVFMFGACASFITYLIAHARAAGLIKT